MTEFHVEVVQIGDIEKHPNADTLSITKVHGGYPVIFKTGDYKPGDLAVYVPVDAIVPDTAEWEFLGKHRRIKAKRLRGIFSMGLLTAAPEGAKVGADVAEQLGITRHDPDALAEEIAARITRAVAPPKPWYVRLWNWAFGKKDPTRPCAPPKLKYLPGVYDIEPYRKYGKHWFNPGELVLVTEKIHGQNASFVHDGKKLHIKSRTRWRKNDPAESQNVWARAAQRYDLEKKLRDHPGLILFGETYGNNSDMPYGEHGDAFMAFDVYDSNKGQWLGYWEFQIFCKVLDIPMVPVLEMGPWRPDVAFEHHAEGKSTLANHVREGFVIKPVTERLIHGGQRVILKMAGEGYLTRKAA